MKPWYDRFSDEPTESRVIAGIIVAVSPLAASFFVWSLGVLARAVLWAVGLL